MEYTDGLLRNMYLQEYYNKLYRLPDMSTYLGRQRIEISYLYFIIGCGRLWFHLPVQTNT